MSPSWFGLGASEPAGAKSAECRQEARTRCDRVSSSREQSRGAADARSQPVTPGPFVHVSPWAKCGLKASVAMPELRLGGRDHFRVTGSAGGVIEYPGRGIRSTGKPVLRLARAQRNLRRSGSSVPRPTACPFRSTRSRWPFPSVNPRISSGLSETLSERLRHAVLFSGRVRGSSTTSLDSAR